MNVDQEQHLLLMIQLLIQQLSPRMKGLLMKDHYFSVRQIYKDVALLSVIFTLIVHSLCWNIITPIKFKC